MRCNMLLRVEIESRLESNNTFINLVNTFQQWCNSFASGSGESRSALRCFI